MNTWPPDTALPRPALDQSEYSARDRSRIEQLFATLETTALKHDDPRLDAFRSTLDWQDHDSLWELLMEWCLSKRRWAEAVSIFEARIKTSTEYTEQPPHTIYMALALERLRRFDEASESNN